MNDKNFIRTKIEKSLRKMLGKKYLTSYELMRMRGMSSMVSSIIFSGRTELRQLALENTDDKQYASKIKQYKRLVTNENIDLERFYFPYIIPLLECLSASGELVFSIDGSTVGRGCMCLMFSVIYKGKAIPIVWEVYKKKKGHLPEKEHCALLEKLKKLVPKGCRVIVTGDGEFDGCNWQEKILSAGWDYVLRTGKNAQITEYDGGTFKAGSVCLEEGKTLFFEQIKFTKKELKTNLLIWHGKGHKSPLITNLDFAPQIGRFYKKRFKIEPFFRDLKTKGFNINRSGLGKPERLKRLLIAACIAYILCILGSIKAYKSKFYDRVALEDEKLLSLFQLGRRFIIYLVDIRQWRAFSITRDLIPEPPFVYNCVPF
jgi:hypothetical protein